MSSVDPALAAVAAGPDISMRTFITRLIWLCVFPPLVLGAWLAVDNVRNERTEFLGNATHLARNLALSIDQSLTTQVSGLQMLSLSSLIDDQRRWPELYRQAQEFQQSFGSHVILASAAPPMQMLLNTRVPLGQYLPLLPRPDGRAAAPTAVASGRPAVGDSFVGPVANQLLVAVAVPVLRQGRATHVVLTTIEVSYFQKILAQRNIPADWSIAVHDGLGKTIARRAPAAIDAVRDVDDEGRISVKLAQAPWSVVVEIPRQALRTPLYMALARFAAILLLALIISVVAGKIAARRLVRGVAGLSDAADTAVVTSGISEIVRARRQLDAAARQRSDDARTLQASESRYTATFEQAAVGIALVAPDGRWLRVNRKLAEIVAYPPEQLLSLTFQSITHPDDLAQDMDLVRRMLAREIDNYSIEKRYLRADGSPVWVKLTVALIWSASGQPDYFVSVVEDVDARRQAQEEVLATKGKLEAALASMTDAVCIADRDGRCVEFNEAFATFHRFASKQECAAALADDPEFLEVRSVSGELLPATQWAVSRALRGETANNAEFVLRRKDGDSSWIASYSFGPIRNQGGEIVGAVIAGRDVSERKLAEIELAQHRHHLEQLVERRTAELDAAYRSLSARSEEIAELYNKAPCGYHSLAPDGVVVSVNDTELELLGYARDEFVGRSIGEFMTPESVQSFQRNFSLFARSGRMRDLEFEFVSKDGTIVPALVSGDIVRDANGKFLRTRSILVDNRERKARERQLSSLQDELARRADEAEAATRSKSAFLANMSHEIRTPMNAILGLTHLLLRSGQTPEQAERLAKIETAGRHLLSIINDVLDLSKIEAGRVELESTDFHLSAILDNIKSLIGEQAGGKGLAVRIDPDAVPVWLRGDPTRLRQSLLNYAANAVKFTEQGEITLRAILLDDDGENLLVRFEVQDTGIGIPADILPGLFRSFEQADATTTRKYGGTGLGLAITRHLAGLMGGEAGAESTLGVGSTFWLTARLGRGHGVVASAANKAPADAESTLRERHRGARLLLAEDNEINREVALELLHSVALCVDTAASGSEAVAKARTHRYDLILMDMQMPEMDGTEATRIIRTLPDWATRPIIAMTANAFAEDRRLCALAGMNDFIAKPVDPDAFFVTLLKWLSFGGGAADDRPAAVARRVEPPLAPAAAGVDADRLPELPGIDSALGLRYIMGRQDHYRRLLIGFRDQHASRFGAGYRAARAGGDWPGAERLAHTLKGLARSVGAVELGERAARLESATQRRDLAAIEQCERAVDDEIALLLAGLRLLEAPPEPADSTPQPAAPAAAQDLLDRLRALLEARDTAAVAAVNDFHGALLGAGIPRRSLAELHAAVTRYDFERALNVLPDLAASLGRRTESSS